MAERAQNNQESGSQASAGPAGASHIGRGPGAWTGRLAVALFIAGAGLVVLVVLFEPATRLGLLFLAAAALASLLRPVAAVVSSKHRVTSGLAVGLGFWAVVAAVLVTIGMLLQEPITEEVERLPEHREELNAVLANVGQWLNMEEPPTVEGILAGVGHWLLSDGDGEGMLGEAVDQAGIFLIAIVLLVFGSTFMLAHAGENLGEGAARLLAPQHRRPFVSALDHIEHRLRWWLVGMFVSVTVVGVASYIGFSIIGLEMALPLAILAGVAELAPIVGPTFAFLLAALFAATEGVFEFFAVIVLWALIQTFESSLVVPVVMRRAVHMPPLVTVFTVVFWARALGPLGLLLAIPLNLVIWTILEQFIIQRRRE